MNTTQFGIYDIETDYLKFLHTKDKHVPYSDYEEQGRQRKFYCGPVYTTADGINFYVPVSSKNLDTKQSEYGNVKSYCIQIEKNGRKYGSLDFRHMVPCFDERITPKKFNPDSNTFGAIQSEYCRCHETDIKTIGAKTFRDSIFETSNHNVLSKTACKFDANIDHMLEYDIYCEENENNKTNTNMTLRAIQLNAVATDTSLSPSTAPLDEDVITK